MFKGKSVPKKGFAKVLEKMKEQNFKLVKERNVTPGVLLNKWNKMMRCTKSYKDHISQTGASALQPPPFYEMFLECIGEEGMVVVEGAPFARDSRRGTSRVGYADKAGGQEDGDNANNSATVKKEEDSSDLTPQKRLTRRQMQEARTGDLSSKFSSILSVIETSTKLINDGANERFLAFQQASKESEERKLAEQRRQHDERMEELRMLLGRK